MKIKLSFLGAAQNVTGSRYLLEANNHRVLIDCGLYQERDFRYRNWDPFPKSPESIDTVILTHAHLDHCGLLPKLVREGFQGNIFCTPATEEITRIVLLDSAHIQEEDARFKRTRHFREKRKSRHPVVPLYTSQDAESVFPLIKSVDYGVPVEIADGIEAAFYEAGHILGSSMVKIKVTENGESRTILFSGDIGRCNSPILEDPTFFDEADYILVESTYGDRIHKDYAEKEDILEEIINWTYQAGGNILIPSFAIERSQELLYFVNKLLLADRIPHLMTFVDSPMAIQVTKVFKNHPELFDEEMQEFVGNHESPFEFPGLKMSRTPEDSKAINHIHGTVIVLAGSGMCTAGRIKHHLVHNISRPESTVLFVGYQAQDTLGRHILEGAKEVRIQGQVRPVKARIAKINGFSAHADKNELNAWLSTLKKPPRRLFVTHGEANAAKHFADFIRHEKRWKVAVPEYEQSFELD